MARPAWKANTSARIIIANQYRRYRSARRLYQLCVAEYGNNPFNPYVMSREAVKLEAWNAMQASIQVAAGMQLEAA